MAVLPHQRHRGDWEASMYTCVIVLTFVIRRGRDFQVRVCAGDRRYRVLSKIGGSWLHLAFLPTMHVSTASVCHHWCRIIAGAAACTPSVCKDSNTRVLTIRQTSEQAVRLRRRMFHAEYVSSSASMLLTPARLPISSPDAGSTGPAGAQRSHLFSVIYWMTRFIELNNI